MCTKHLNRIHSLISKNKQLAMLLKRSFLIFVLVLLSIVLLELVAKIVNHTILRTKINPENLKSEFEQIYIPPFAQKKPDEFWVFIYGGSSVQGLPLPKAGFVNQFDYQMNHVFAGKNIKVFNFGWAGLNSTRIRYVFDRTIGQKPDLAIVYTGENEYIYPQLDFYPLVKTVTALKNKTDLGKLLMYATSSGQSEQTGELLLSSQRYPPYGANKLLTKLKMVVFENNLKGISQEAQKQSVPLVLAAAASNIADWPPVRRSLTTLKVKENYEAGILEVNKLIGEGKLTEAKGLVETLLRQYSDDAFLLYLTAQIARENGQDAKELLEAARDKDLVPWRATSGHIESMRRLAEEKKVWFINIKKIFDENSPQKATGFNFILDGTHPNKEGAYLLTSSLVNFIKDNGLVKKEWVDESQSLYSADEVFGAIALTSADDEFMYVRTAGLALKLPLHNLEGARYYLDNALKINEGNWETWAVYASLTHLERKDEEAKVYLDKAGELKGAKIRREDVQFIPYLYEIIPE